MLLLSFKDYQLEIDTNSEKSRTEIYINNRIECTRRLDLEGEDSLVVFVDITGTAVLKIISTYRCFNPQNETSAREAFIYQYVVTSCLETQKSIKNLDM